MAEDKKKGVTNADVLKFYKDAPTDEGTCPCTAKYLERLKKDGESLHGPYSGLIDTFRGINPDPDADDCDFYTRLRDLESSGALFQLNALKDLDPHFDVFLEHTNKYDVGIQKWHLYVSWYAYKQFQVENKIGGKYKNLNAETMFRSDAKGACGILKHPISCPELLLWMYEAAGGDKTKEKVKKLKEPGWAKDMREEIYVLLEK